jgi:ankyrin repeat protein
LLANGARVDIQDSYHRTALHVAARKHKESNERNKLLEIEPHRTEIARLLLDHHAPLETQDRDGFTPLHRALYDGTIGVANLLLERNANINAQTRNQETPLHFAALLGDSAMVQACLEKIPAAGREATKKATTKNAAVKNAADAKGLTPLQYAQLKPKPDAALIALLTPQEPAKAS